jgi:hypothetical protein
MVFKGDCRLAGNSHREGLYSPGYSSYRYECWQFVAKIAFDLTSVEEINRLISVENDRIGLRSQDGPITS